MYFELTGLFYTLSIFFALFAVIVAITNFSPPIEKLGIALFWDNVKWTWFIYKNLDDAKILNKKHFYIKDKIIVFYCSCLFEVYEGKTIEEIESKYSLGGQSNKASYLTWWEKKLGKEIEKK